MSKPSTADLAIDGLRDHRMPGAEEAEMSRTTGAIPGAVAIALMLLSACSVYATPSMSEMPSLAAASATPSPSPTQAISATPVPTRPTDQPAVTGLGIDDVLAFLAGQGLDCEPDIPPRGADLPTDLIGAQCIGRAFEGGPVLQVDVGYWPDGAISFVEANSCCSDDGIQRDVQPADRAAWLRWFAGIPYDGADPAAVRDWLLGNTAEMCGQGCTFTVGSASWFHAVADSYDFDQVAFGPLP